MEHELLWTLTTQINKEHSQVARIILFFSYYLHATMDRRIWNVSFIATMMLRAMAWELRIHAST